jgi:hypothetical protein
MGTLASRSATLQPVSETNNEKIHLLRYLLHAQLLKFAAVPVFGNQAADQSDSTVDLYHPFDV